MNRPRARPHTLPSSPTRSSSASSSDFEFTISTHGDESRSGAAGLHPADDLFYKGQLLPLHPSPRLSMVKSLLTGSTTSSSSSSYSRDSSGSSSSSDVLLFRDYACDESPLPTSAAYLEDDFIARSSQPLNTTAAAAASQRCSAKKSKSFSLVKLSSVFKKEPRTTKKTTEESSGGGGAADSSCPLIGRTSGSSSSSSARDVFRKYVEKVKQKMSTQRDKKMDRSAARIGTLSNSFSGNTRIRDRRNNNNKVLVMMSCPSSIRSSPCHSGVLSSPIVRRPVDSSMEQVQSAIQEAIAHCKSSMMQNKSSPTPTVSDEI